MRNQGLKRTDEYRMNRQSMAGEHTDILPDH